MGTTELSIIQVTTRMKKTQFKELTMRMIAKLLVVGLIGCCILVPGGCALDEPSWGQPTGGYGSSGVSESATYPVYTLETGQGLSYHQLDAQFFTTGVTYPGTEFISIQREKADVLGADAAREPRCNLYSHPVKVVRGRVYKPDGTYLCLWKEMPLLPGH